MFFTCLSRHGTLFGADQSGVKDVGMDLQAAILKQAVDEFKKQFILSGSSGPSYGRTYGHTTYVIFRTRL